MNPTIVKIIDMMFRGMPQNDETAAMREELLTNSQARYDDLIAAGESPDTALGQVLDNLRGMEDVLDGYKQGKRSPLQTESSDPFARFEQIAEEMEDKWDAFTDKAETTAKNAFESAMTGFRSAMDEVSGFFNGEKAQTEPQTSAEPYRAAAGYTSAQTTRSWVPAYDAETHTMVFAPGEITRVNIQLTGEDIQVEPSPDGQVHLEIDKDDESLYLVDHTGGCLVLRHKPFASAAMDQSTQNEEYQGLSGILSGIGRAVRNALQSVRSCGDTLRLLVPDGLEQITLQTTNGDIEINSLRQKAFSISTASGDVEIKDSNFSGPVYLNATSGDLEIKYCLFEAPLTINTTSGDIEFSGNAPQLTVNTTSGDGEIKGELPAIHANTVSGDFFFDITCPKTQLKANATSGDLTVVLPHGTDATVHTRTVSGDVSVTCATCEGAEANVQLSSVSGDLAVRNF